MKGIDKRAHKDGTDSYRASVSINGHPVLVLSFASKTLAIKWKRFTESAVDQGSMNLPNLAEKFFNVADRSLYQ